MLNTLNSTPAEGNMAAQAYRYAQTSGREVAFERKANFKKEKISQSPSSGSAPPPPRMPSGNKNEGSGAGKVLVPLIISLITITLAFGVFLAFFFDVGGLKTYTAQVFLEEDSFYTKQMLLLDSKIAESERKAQEADASKLQYEAKIVDLDKQQKQLDNRKKELDAQEAKLNEQLASLNTAATQMDQLVATLSKLDSAAAARLLEKMENKNDVANLLSRMEVKQAAAVLENMTPEISSELTQLMLNFAQ